MPPWRVLPFHVATAAQQLAYTESLWRAVAAGDAPATLRWYGYAAPALVLGIGQDERAVNAAAARRAGLAIVKRSSGGAVVYAGPELIALDVALPSDSPLAIPDVVESYRWLGEAFMQALTSPTNSAALVLVSPDAARADQLAQRGAPPGSPAHARSLACFGVLSPYEVALDGQRKLIGFSQIRKRGVALLQVGLYTHFSGQSLARFLPPTNDLSGELDRRIASLADVGLIAPNAAAAVIDAVTDVIERTAPPA